MTKLKIKVTKKHIIAGTCGDTFTCAVALAVREVLPYIKVNRLEIYVYDSPITIERLHLGRPIAIDKIDLPIEVCEFIDAFDDLDTGDLDRHLLEGIEFEIELSDKVLETINIEEVSLLLQNHPTLSLINI